MLPLKSLWCPFCLSEHLLPPHLLFLKACELLPFQQFASLEKENVWISIVLNFLSFCSFHSGPWWGMGVCRALSLLTRPGNSFTFMGLGEVAVKGGRREALSILSLSVLRASFYSTPTSSTEL